MRVKFNSDWMFQRSEESESSQVTLPHSAVQESTSSSSMWQGNCSYVKMIDYRESWLSQDVSLHFEGAMQHSKIYINNSLIQEHSGGYTPFSVLLSDHIHRAGKVELRVELSNTYAAHIPPAKVIDELDFKWYHGLYRNVWLNVTEKIHVSDPFLPGADKDDGIKVQTLAADQDQARVKVQAKVLNNDIHKSPVKVKLSLQDMQSSEYAVFEGIQERTVQINAQEGKVLDFIIQIHEPKLWSVDSPNRYKVIISISNEQGRTEIFEKKVGLRRISFSRSKGFQLNGETLRLRGTNRHQEYPCIGYALSDNAQKRDAMCIKEAGFDYVRLSHYPQSPAFLEACDELGIVVMNCIPGWQHLGGEAFKEACYQNARDIIRRDGHHPCVVLWELSLNETDMPNDFMETLQAIGHEEMPGDQMFTCGWMDKFDVYIRSRQHGQLNEWKNGDKALVVAEYGDWEYYARNDGFEQTEFGNLYPFELNSRKGRANGHRGLLKQMENHEEALNDNLQSPACLDGQWAMFDYMRGYSDDCAEVGVMDIYRFPKYSFDFYKSQRRMDPSQKNTAFIKILHQGQLKHQEEWVVVSNVEQVELFADGVPMEFVQPQRASHLPCPPQRFKSNLEINAGTKIVAKAYWKGECIAEDKIYQHGSAVAVAMDLDFKNVLPSGSVKDQCFLHVKCVDEDGRVDTSYEGPVSLECADVSFTLYPSSSVMATAGVASFLIESDDFDIDVLQKIDCLEFPKASIEPQTTVSALREQTS